MNKSIVVIGILMTIIGWATGSELGIVAMVMGVLFIAAGMSSYFGSDETPQAEVQVHPASSAASGVLAICPKCKARISATSKFCPECGEDLISTTDKRSKSNLVPIEEK